MREAMRRVRDDLGPEAVILSNRRTAEGVEVTAAIDHAAGTTPPDRSSVLAEPLGPAARQRLEADTLDAGRSSPASQGDAGASASLALMQSEIRSLRGLLEEQIGRLTWDDIERRHPSRTEALQRLIGLGLRRELAHRVARKVPAKATPADAWSHALKVLVANLRVGADEVP